MFKLFFDEGTRVIPFSLTRGLPLSDRAFEHAFPVLNIP
jgi:hypothetical protein